MARALATGALLACLLGQAGAAARPSAEITTVVEISSPILALAQDRNRIAWLRGPDWRPRVEVLDLGTRTRTRVPARSSVRGRDWTMPSLALAGDRAVYVFGEGWGNTGLAYSIVTAAVSDSRERLVFYDDSMSRPAVRERFPWPMAADGDTVVFAAGERLRRLASRRSRPLAGPKRDLLSVAGNNYATAWLKSFGECICNVAPSWSPDGKRLVYASGLRLGQQSAGWKSPHGIHVVDAAGTRGRFIARGVNPDWSPDGALIAYERQLGASSIWVIRPDGTRSRRLLAGNDPDWSPDGKRIAFVRNRQIFVADEDGSDARRVTTAGLAPDWSPDGRKITYMGAGSGIYVINADGTGRMQLRVPETYSSSPRWLPDGRTIAYDVITGDDFTEAVYLTRIGLANADGSAGESWFDLPRRALTAAWSPAGRRVAYAGWLAGRHPARDIPSTEIFIADSDGKDERRVTATRVAEPTSGGIVRRLSTGKPAARLATEGAVRDVALTPQVAAMLVKGFFGKRVEVLNARTGRRVRRIDVPQDTVPRISAAGNRIVIAAGLNVLLLDARTGKVTTVARSSAAPRGLSIEGRRVAWFENIRGRGRVRMLTLPK